MVKILVVEDDKELNAFVSKYLQSNGYEVVSCYNGAEAYDKFCDEQFALIATDIMMPVMDGFVFAEKVRMVDKQIPILFMTARDDKMSKQIGYRIGIDDYLSKPFDIDELVMRVGALLRRANINASKTLSVGNLTMDKEEHTAYLNGNELVLTVREFDILFKLLSNPKKTYTRSALMDEFWDYDSSASSRTVDVYMAKLREKTANCNGFEIVTVHGLGYKVVLNEKR